MNKFWIAAVMLVLLGNLGLTGYLLNSKKEETPEKVVRVSEEKSVEYADLKALRDEVLRLQDELHSLPVREEAPVLDEGFERRLNGIEESLSQLESSMDGMSLEAASEEREALFRGANGHLKAAEYFAAGKYELAGEGILTFLAEHSDHPEHRSLVEKARQAFAMAGNMDRAIAVQEELMEIYPDTKAGDMMTLARLQQRAGKYQEAAENAKESAGLVNDSSKYWNLMYSAWYTQLGDGLDAGLVAYREVEEQILAAGHGDGKLGERAREKITEIEREIAAQGQ